MTAITFLASSKPFKIPPEILKLTNRSVFEKEEDFHFFTIQEIHASWEKEVKEVLSLPYLYEVEGVGTHSFMTYLEKYMEIGDVFEIYNIPNQHAFESYVKQMQEDPAPILVDTGMCTYQDRYGSYQFQPNKWLEELSHRNYITPYGITTFVKTK